MNQSRLTIYKMFQIMRWICLCNFYLYQNCCAKCKRNNICVKFIEWKFTKRLENFWYIDVFYYLFESFILFSLCFVSLVHLILIFFRRIPTTVTLRYRLCSIRLLRLMMEKFSLAEPIIITSLKSSRMIKWLWMYTVSGNTDIYIQYETSFDKAGIYRT